MHVWQVSAAIGALGVIVSLAASAAEPTQQQSDRAVAACADVKEMIDQLVDFTDTMCLPTAVASPSGLSFMLIADKPVFSVEASKKAWLLVGLGAIGYVLNEKRPDLKADQAVFTDAERAKAGTGYFVDASVLKSLQRRVKSGAIDLESAYAELTKNLHEKHVPETVHH